MQGIIFSLVLVAALSAYLSQQVGISRYISIPASIVCGGAVGMAILLCLVLEI